MSKGKNSGLALGLLAGAAIGVAIGILYAPEQGKETRKKLKKKAEDLKDQAINEYGNLSEKTKENVDKIVSNVKQSYEKYKGQAVDKATGLAKEVETELDALK